MSLLQKIRPRWLRAILRFTWQLLVGLLVGGAVIGICAIIATYLPPFSDMDPQQQLSLVGIASIVILLVGQGYIYWKRNRAHSWFRVGKRLLAEKRYQEALSAYEQAIAIRPRYSGAWVNKANILCTLKRYDEALADLDHVLTFDPSDTSAWNNKGSVLCDYLERYDAALAVCDEALSRGISTAGIWALKGNSLQHLGQEAEARAAFERVLAFPANDFVNWAGRGLALTGMGRYQEALAAYDQALAANDLARVMGNNEADVLREKAITLRALGRDDEAQEAERQADELERAAPAQP